jgi:hypothetical protein
VNNRKHYSVQQNCIYIFRHLNGQRIPQAEDAKYLGLYLDRRLNWRKHISTKGKQLN